MTNTTDRRHAKRAYKEQQPIGGIYRIAADGWHSKYMATLNLHGLRGKLQFAQNTQLGFDSELQEKLKQLDGAFTLEVLEELKKRPEQSTAEFRKELDMLLTLYLEEQQK